ncbi:sugar phosphate isomerase/epimerase [Bacillus sp. EB600]|uniref:sugar phosphate isomerase/epimerase family protein n=1 Tax=Bacillus sp. EB600 TaxID=2806345 RepID=UPI00210BF622|nr:TIM barrel protein [Bacillus sp. EB600]MCQ6278549.1 sugar phosphate isomerase/epimerase [Bacillus sp. EB600]
MLKLGVKSSYHPEQLYDRLTYKPDIIELHLVADDLFGEKRKQLEATISMLKSQECEVYLHHPSKYNGRFLDIIHEQREDYLFYHLSTRILADICATHSIKCVIHPHYSRSNTSAINKGNRDKMVHEISRILTYGNDSFLWENSIVGLFTAENPYWFEDFIQPLGLPLTYDISHAFISFKGNNQLLLEQIKKLAAYIQYFHVVDSKGQKHDGLPLGTGHIQWKPIIPYLMSRPYIYEITLKDQTNAIEMVQSHTYLSCLSNQ